MGDVGRGFAPNPNGQDPPAAASAPAAPPSAAPADTVTVQTDPLAPVESGKVIEAEAPSAAAKLREMLATRNAAWVETYVKTIDTVVNDKEGKRLNTLALETLVSMAEAAVPVIKAGLRETKAADVPSKTKLRRELAAAFNNFEGEWLTEYAATLSSTVDLGYDQQLEFVFNKPDKEKIEALRARDSQKRREILVERGIESFDSISKSHTERIMAEISRGVDAGETIQQITRRVADTFADPEAMAARAATIARTETLTAVSIGQGAAFRNASEIIPGLRKGWLNADDSRVRDTHLDKSQGGVSGEVVGADEAFSNGLRWPRDVTSGDPGQVINCFPSGTNVEALGLQRTFQRHYRGPMATVNFISGEQITATPNHPVLTDKGWVGVGFLNKGCKVFKAGGFDISGARGEGDINHIKASIDKVFSSSLKSALANMRLVGAGSDFHGDGAAEDVDIVDLKGGLNDGAKPDRFKIRANLSLADSNLAAGDSFSFSRQGDSGSGVRPPHGSISASDLGEPLRFIEPGPLETFSLGATALDYSDLFKPSINSGSSDAKHPADLRDGEKLYGVQLDEVASVDVRPFEGHVYNLQTTGGYYIAGKVISHNCRCTMVTLLPGEDLQA